MSSSKPELKQLLTAKDVAAAWRCSEREVLEKARAREIPSFKIGRLVRFSSTDIDQYVLTQKRAVLGRHQLS